MRAAGPFPMTLALLQVGEVRGRSEEIVALLIFHALQSTRMGAFNRPPRL